MLSVFAEAASGAVDRFFKRRSGKDVTPDDYKMLWAETTESGLETITEVPKGNETEPKFRLVARKIEDTPQWNVTKEKLIFDPKMILEDAPFLYRGDFDTGRHFNSAALSFRYDVIAELGIMSEKEAVKLLKDADTTERVMGHISGLSRGKGSSNIPTQPAPDDGTRMTYNS